MSRTLQGHRTELNKKERSADSLHSRDAVSPPYARLYSSVFSLLQKPVSGSSRGQSAATSSRSKDRKWRSCVIHIAPANCAESTSRDEQVSEDVDDRL